MQNAVAASGATAPRPTVLMVDDREANLLALGAVLEGLDVRLVKASSGREALKFLLDGECALILLDVQMPDLDGFETATLIHARARTRYLPIIFVTAVHREEAEILKGYTHGAVDYIVKPFDAAALVAKVRVCLDQHAREQRLVEEAALRTRERDAATRREQAALAAAEEQRVQLHALFLEAPGAIAIVGGEEPVFELANPRFEAMVGVSPLRGRAVRDVLPDAAAQATADLLNAVAGSGRPVTGHEVPDLFGRVGRRFSFVAQPMRDGPDERTRAMIHVHDVTDEVLALHRAEALAAELQQAGRNKDAFLAMLSHELRNPLAAIVSAAYLMQLRDGSRCVERERGIVERQARHLARLVDDLLDVSRVTTGKVELRREPVRMAEAVARAIEVATPLLEARSHQLSVQVPEEGLLVDGDPTRLAQVIANLLHNAAKYTEEGGRIGVEGHLEGATVVLSVSDNGRGIAGERLSSVFELFEQGDQRPERSEGGLGVGLTLARSLVRSHGGEVEAKSDGPGAGSTFTVRLPSTSAPPPAPQPPAAETAGRRRVLVVDDNADSNLVLAQVLGHAGHQVREATDGLEALAAALEFQPDVILLDLGLPGLDGIEVARRLRADPRTAKARLVALTGYGQESDRLRTAKAGIDHHLVKPVALDLLLRIVAAPESFTATGPGPA